MGKCLSENEFAKIPITGDQNPLLTLGERQHLVILDTGRIVTSNTPDIVTKLGKIGSDAKLDTLIEKESHQ